MNSVVLVGRAGQDSEIKYFDSGKIKTTFSLAVGRWDSKTKSETTDWFNVEVWDKQAEFASEYVKKGKQVCLDGRLCVNKWQGQDGEQKSRFVVRCNNIRLLGSKNDAQ